ncbi:MAG: sulfatase-like hydrolase/transferase [Akkermansiaceae bacterium]
MRIMMLLALATVGSLIWSVNVKLVHKTEQSFAQKTSWALGILGAELTLIILGYLQIVTGYSYFILGISVNVVFFCVNLGNLETRDEFSSILHRLYAWLVSRARWNAVFYIAVFLILITHNMMLIYNMSNVDFWPKFSLFFNRFFNQVALISLLYIVIQSSLYVAPKWSRSIIWIISSIIPLLIISDYYTHTVWNTSIISLINSTGIEGFLDIENALKGGGIQTPILQLALLLGGGLLVLFMLVWLCNILSKRFNCMLSPRTAVFVALFSIMGATLEQSIGGVWKNTRDQVVEASEFDFQVSIVKTSAILADFEVEFKDHSAVQKATSREMNFKHKPDIYLIFIESFRADALTAEVTPELYQFQSEDAQELEKSWASSNGTHVSWFGTFTGRLPVYWKSDRELKEANQWPGLNAFREFKESGYELGAYIATELEYRNMGLQFFGKQGDIFATIRDNREDDLIYEQPIPERERMLFEDLKARVQTRDAGGHFDIVGLDSSHFYYSWHEDFEPPFNPYYTFPYYLPANPDAAQIKLVTNKYHNSLAWCDHIVGDFLSFLKEEGKYDDSIVIVLGDHGEELQDHGGWLHVSSLEEEQIRVPLLIKWPKSYGRGVAQGTASQLDILPSLLDYLTDGESKHLLDLDFPGNSLLESNDQTIIAYTGMGGKTKDALVFTRDGYKAYFSWLDYWNWRTSNKISLTQFYGPEGRIRLGSDEAYLAKLKEVFPDVKDRVFERFGTLMTDWERVDELPVEEVVEQ